MKKPIFKYIMKNIKILIIYNFINKILLIKVLIIRSINDNNDTNDNMKIIIENLILFLHMIS